MTWPTKPTRMKGNGPVERGGRRVDTYTHQRIDGKREQTDEIHKNHLVGWEHLGDTTLHKVTVKVS